MKFKVQHFPLMFSVKYFSDRDSCLTLPGYHDLITRIRNDDNRGGVGLHVFIKDNIHYKIRECKVYLFCTYFH